MRYGFFDAQIIGYDGNGLPRYDRAENAEFFSEFFESFLDDGIYPTPANGFAVAPAGGMSVNVAAGRCLIRGRFGWAEQSETLSLISADSNRGRIDRIVLRLDLNNRDIRLAVLQGEYSSVGYTPAELTRDLSLGIWELGIAEIEIPAASSEISAERIRDLRHNKQFCGFVSSIGTLEADTSIVSVAADEWEGTSAPYSVTKTVSGVTDSNNIVVSAAAESMALWLECGCYASAQSNGTVTFKALYSLPSDTLFANVLIVG